MKRRSLFVIFYLPGFAPVFGQRGQGLAISKRKHPHLRLHLLLVCFALWTSGSWGQTTWGLSPKLEGFIKAHPQTTLYLHLDKNNYSPGEHIWFKAYVLSGRVIDNRVLYVRLPNRRHPVFLLKNHRNCFANNEDVCLRQNRPGKPNPLTEA